MGCKPDAQELALHFQGSRICPLGMKRTPSLSAITVEQCFYCVLSCVLIQLHTLL